ncbi:MAG TPA: NAD(P)/FAD-dependent oxidoreductase [Terriglobales bacterium]|jgi:flavin-dependent dehydrogenase|nr:NAD(P)/FAD-dependent oxidoreductase [Terriglobales bacterium]
MFDLAIVGGGPAGTSAAITARSAGVNVLLLERGIIPRHKVCGEFVSAESLDLLYTLLSSKHKPLLKEALRISQTRIFLDGQTIKTQVHPEAVSIARLDLDAALWSSAQDCGVDARQRTTVHKISGSGPFRMHTSDGDFESRAVVNASGRWSNLTADTSLSNGSLERWLGIKGHFSEPATHPSVDLYFFDGGYCGVQPVNLREPGTDENRINACAMVRADVASTLMEVLNCHPQLKERSQNWRPLSAPMSTSPLLFRIPVPDRGEILMAGDAAAFVDPFVGDGISLALRSGALAAQCLVPFFQKDISLQDATLAYRRIYQERLAHVFNASSMIRRALKLPRAIRKPMIYFVRTIPSLPKYLVKRTRGSAELLSLGNSRDKTASRGDRDGMGIRFGQESAND